MKTSDTEARRLRRSLSPAAAIPVVLMVFAPLAIGQQTTSGSPLKQRIQGRVKVLDENMPSKIEMDNMPAVVVAEGKNNRAIGEFRLRKYRIEELRLTRPVQAEIEGHATQVWNAWRITITGGPFEVRNMPAIIWVDDSPVGIGLEAPDLRSISAITFDSAVVRNGASIGFSYGPADGSYTLLREKLELFPKK